MTGPAAAMRRARLDTVRARGRSAKRLLAYGLILALLWGAAAGGSAAAASESTDPVVQEQPAEAPQPSDSDDEVRLVMALLIAVAVIALLGTLVYWVRTGDSARRGGGDSSDSPEPEDTLG